MKKIYIILLILFSAIPAYTQIFAGRWKVEFPDDNFTHAAALDLRYSNKEIAGQNSFIKLSTVRKVTEII